LKRKKQEKNVGNQKKNKKKVRESFETCKIERLGTLN
jgi:hypothetical protein